MVSVVTGSKRRDSIIVWNKNLILSFEECADSYFEEESTIELHPQGTRIDVLVSLKFSNPFRFFCSCSDIIDCTGVGRRFQVNLLIGKLFRNWCWDAGWARSFLKWISWGGNWKVD